MDVVSYASRVHNVKPEECFYETPHIDRLAKEGMTFTQAYSAARDGAVMIYVEAERRLIVFGGAAPVGLFNDVWALEGFEPPNPTAIGELSARPVRFALHQNAPNPFNPSTVVSYELGKDEWVELEIFDLLGRKVRTLVDEPRSSGSHLATWDGRDDRGVRVATGAYLYRLRAGGFVASRKLLLIR